MKTQVLCYRPKLDNVRSALVNLKGVADKTPLQQNLYYSDLYDANIFFKREDLQLVRSYKIRGAYNKISQLSKEEIKNGVVCSSAGNHAQGFALACSKLKIRGAVFMPLTTPQQKIEQVEMFGKGWIDVYLAGDTFDNAQYAAKEFCKEKEAVFIPPFDDEKVIEGQATIALELLEQAEDPIDYLILPIGGGGLAAGVSTIFNILSPSTKIIGVEPAGAPSLSESLKSGSRIRLEEIDKFVDGAAVQQMGKLTFDLCRDNLDEVITIDEGLICKTMLDLYNKNAIVCEPAGALSISALKILKEKLKNKNVVCLLSGGNNDIVRTEEIRERAMLYENLKHYFVVRFPQRSGALKEFVMKVLGPEDDITFFEYSKKNSRTRGSAVIGIEIKHASHFEPLVTRMKRYHFYEQYLNENEKLMNFLV